MPAAFPARAKLRISVCRTFRIARDAGRAGLQHAEIGHAPLGRVVADQHDAIAVLDALAREEAGNARGEFTQIGIGVLFLAPIALDAHRDARCMALGRSLKQLEQIAIGVNALRFRAHFVFERWKHPLRESGQDGC